MTTPAMTAQEALAAVRTANAYDSASDRDRSLRRAADALEHALADAERRATSWERSWLEAEGQLTTAQSRLSAVEAERDEARAAQNHNADVGISAALNMTCDAMDLGRQLAAVEARCGLMEKGLRWIADAREHEPQQVSAVLLSACMLTARSILAYPGGKSDQGEKEKL